MLKFFNLLFVIIFSLYSSHSYSHEQLTIDDSLYSKVLNEERKLVIQLPENYDLNKGLQYPVLYLLDGPSNMSHTSGTLDFINKKSLAPELIIVGIANTDRGRDLTPIPTKQGEEDFGGGADKFLDFIESELLPYIDKKYRTQSYKILTGHSFGGLFVIHTLQSRPHLFQAHIAFSPSLQWADKGSVKPAIDFFNKTKDYKNYLYMNLGNEKGAMREGFDELSALLKQKAIKGFKFDSELYESETHMTTPYIGQFRALRSLYSGWNINYETIGDDPLKDIEKHYQELSNQYGYQINSTESTVNNVGYYLLYQKENKQKAIEVFAFNVKSYPKSANTYDSLAEAYELNGEIDKALKQMDIALSLTDKSNQSFTVYNQHKEKLLKLEKQSDKK